MTEVNVPLCKQSISISKFNGEFYATDNGHTDAILRSFEQLDKVTIAILDKLHVKINIDGEFTATGKSSDDVVRRLSTAILFVLNTRDAKNWS